MTNNDSQSKPGYTTIEVNGSLVNVPTDQSSNLSGGGYYIPGVGGGSGSYKAPNTNKSSSDAARLAAEEAARQKLLEAARLAAEEAKRRAAEKRAKLISAFRESQTNKVLQRGALKRLQDIQKAEALEEKLRRDVIGKLRTKELRGQATTLDELKLGAAIFTQSLLANGLAVLELPKVLNEVRKNPRIVKRLPAAVKSQAVQFGQLARESPASATAKVAAELVTLKGISRGVKSSEEFLTAIRAGREVKAGEVIRVPTGVGREKVNIKIVGRLPKESMGSQIGRAGSVSRVATSSQANRLIGLIRTGKVVRKPLGTTKAGKRIEDALSKAGKIRLRHLDSGKISTRDIIALDREIRRKGSKGLLERSFFADPTGRVRPSRLGLQKEKPLTLYESISEDITFSRSKPQVLVFTDAQIEKFPKALRSIRNKILRGKPLTKDESARLLSFQLKRSGKFKPLGFTSRESEITLAPGEIIKKQKVIGSINVRGRRVPIVKVDVYKPKGETKKLIADLSKRKVNAKKIANLEKRLKRETGLDYKLSSKVKGGTRYVSARKASATALSRALARYRTSSPKSRVSRRSPPKRSPRSPPKSPRRGSPTSRYRSGGSGAKSPVRRSPNYSPRPSPRSIARVLPRPGRPVPFSRLPKGFKQRTLSKTVDTYYVVEKVRGRFRKLYPKPLTAKGARDFAAYAIDNRLSKTAFFVPLGKNKKVVTPPRNVQGYFSKTSRKYRPYRIRFGKKQRLVNGYIEKRPFFRDTKGETQALKRLQRRPVRRSRPISLARRRRLLQQLKKARMVRMRNLRRKRR